MWWQWPPVQWVSIANTSINDSLLMLGPGLRALHTSLTNICKQCKRPKHTANVELYCQSPKQNIAWNWAQCHQQGPPLINAVAKWGNLTLTMDRSGEEGAAPCLSSSFYCRRKKQKIFWLCRSFLILFMLACGSWAWPRNHIALSQTVTWYFTDYLDVAR